MEVYAESHTRKNFSQTLVKLIYLDKFEENDEVLMNSKLPSSFRNLKVPNLQFEMRMYVRKEKKLKGTWSRSFFMV